ncbi:MAG: hypothetical protein JOS17DRAFT_750540 [Linnemannia elongata]|nr:MAG: hypothetical protein JOS17DRAFT_750540 [Linnemannia elongata]
MNKGVHQVCSLLLASYFITFCKCVCVNCQLKCVMGPGSCRIDCFLFSHRDFRLKFCRGFRASTSTCMSVEIEGQRRGDCQDEFCLLFTRQHAKRDDRGFIW